MKPFGHNGFQVIHVGRNDIASPRGTDLSIRPKPEQCIDWAEKAGFRVISEPEIIEPYHYGLLLVKQ